MGVFSAISELTGRLEDGSPEIKDVFVFAQKGVDAQGQIQGEYTATGYVPKCFDDLVNRGLSISKNLFVPPNRPPS